MRSPVRNRKTSVSPTLTRIAFSTGRSPSATAGVQSSKLATVVCSGLAAAPDGDPPQEPAPALAELHQSLGDELGDGLRLGQETRERELARRDLVHVRSAERPPGRRDH